MSHMRFCFFIERHLGLGSVAGVLERYVRRQTKYEVIWCDVTYFVEGGGIERLPALPDGAKGVMRAWAQTGAALDEGPFDALFFMTHNPAVLRQGALAGAPGCVWTDVTPKQLDELADAYAHPVSASAVVRIAKRAAVTRTFRLARRCLGWSDWTRRSFVADYGVDEKRTAVVPPAVDVSAWDVGRPAPDPSRPFRVIFVGGHLERKGGRLLLDVYRERLRDSCELTIVTREDLADEPGVRVLRGITAGSSELREALRDADAFVLPTFADCLPIASLEAMAAGLPVVLTRVGAAAEVVEHGASGLLVRPRDGRELGDAIAALAADRTRALGMGARGRAIVAERFDVSSVAAQIFGHLVHVAREPRRALQPA